MMLDQTSVLTIDGPAASGKGTVAALFADRFKWRYLDSGILYRIIGFLVNQYYNQDISSSEQEISHLIENDLQISFSIQDELRDSENSQLDLEIPYLVSVELDHHGYSTIYLNQKNVTDQIRSNVSAQLASRVATLPAVRKSLIPFQREQRIAPGLVADGRDMGTVVFPDAQLKIFLNASTAVRALRRVRQFGLKESKESIQDVLQDIDERDKRDALRDIAPLKPAEDAVVIDGSALTIEETFDLVVELATQRKLI